MKGRPAPVYVYRNLRHGKGALPLYSIMQKGRVIAREHRVLLSNCTFVVREKGRQRVIQEGRKNVHAFVKGYLVDDQGVFGIDRDSPKNLPAKLSYNPYLRGDFTWEGKPVKAARAVLLNEAGITACYLD
jgi:hypothetical protein